MSKQVKLMLPDKLLVKVASESSELGVSLQTVILQAVADRYQLDVSPPTRGNPHAPKSPATESN